MTHQPTTITDAARRSDAGMMRLTSRDITGLALAGDIYGAPYDLMAGCLDVRPDRQRGIVARWRNAGSGTDGPSGWGCACSPPSSWRWW